MNDLYAMRANENSTATLRSICLQRMSLAVRKGEGVSTQRCTVLLYDIEIKEVIAGGDYLSELSGLTDSDYMLIIAFCMGQNIALQLFSQI